jgi:hypothetical protein
VARDSHTKLLKCWALVVAWRFLNSAMSPIGRIVMLAALAALIEDYVTWKEGGR